MFDDVTEACDALELAQSSANRHEVPFYVVSHEVFGGRSMLRITNIPPGGDYLEKVSPTRIPLTPETGVA